MYIVAFVNHKKAGWPIFRPVVAKQAGGCTLAELPKENERMARRAAAEKYGGVPLDYKVTKIAWYYENKETAEIVVKSLLEKDEPSPRLSDGNEIAESNSRFSL